MRKAKIQSAYDQRPDATAPVTLTLPIVPPSTNNLFVNVPGKGRIKSAEYNRWINQAGMLVRGQCRERMAVRANVSIFIEEKQGADIDNRIKPVLDLLVRVGVLAGDSAKFVRSVSATWSPEIEGMSIQVWPAPVGMP